MRSGAIATDLSLILLRLRCSVAECLERGVLGSWSVPALPLQLPPLVSTLTESSAIKKVHKNEGIKTLSKSPLPSPNLRNGSNNTNKSQIYHN